ncbi:MAG: DUF5996 family protein [Candidatus Rokuibacteriota bacterium]
MSDWPPLPLAAWRDTQATLHMWTQIVGKTCLALAPPQNHWWHVALHVTSRGLSTGPLPFHRLTFEVAFDFVDHALAVRTSEGATRLIPLVAQPVAQFYRQYLATLGELGLTVKLWPVPVEVERAIPFADDREHATYDPEYAHRFWRTLIQVDQVLKRFRGRFLGKSSPVHFFWGGFDLACTRFSGRGAPQHPGGIPNCPDYVAQEAYSHECASCGFWPGGGVVAEPAFYAYAYPAPPGYAEAAVQRPAFYSRELGEFILPYEAVQRAERPDELLLGFVESTYTAAADLARWDRRVLER